ncbi:MAG: hypothetical protein Q9170_005966 [Blastenia crenularia]
MRFSIAASFLALLSLSQAQLPNYGGFTAKTPAEAMTVASIHSVLALFNLALDSKNFEAMRDVYTENVIAKVARTPTNDLESLIKFYNGKALGDVITQHTAHTNFVYDLAPKSANALYFSKIGEGQFFARDVDTFYQRYDDVWARQSNGQWKISDRSINIYIKRPRARK